MKTAALVVAFGLAASACDDAGSRVSGDEQSIINGAPAPNDVAVVGIGQRSVGCGADAWSIECTGTLVAPRVVVTAAHCLGLAPPNAQQVFFGASLSEGGIVIPVVGGRAHPQFDPTTHANDIAALILESDAPVAPIPMRATPLPDLTGTDVRLVGFGLTSITTSDTGVRRAGTARVTAVGADDVTMEPSPAMSCRGGSGGPVLADTGGGEQLIGVTSHGDAACAEYGVAIRVDRQLQAFLQPILAEAAAPPARRPFDPDEPLCATPCSADADCPAETVCFALGDGPPRCVYRGVPAGEFDAECTADDTTCALACLAMPDGSCRRHIPCESLGTSECRPDDPGCGCRTASPRSIVLVAPVLVSILRRRRRRPLSAPAH